MYRSIPESIPYYRKSLNSYDSWLMFLMSLQLLSLYTYKIDCRQGGNFRSRAGPFNVHRHPVQQGLQLLLNSENTSRIEFMGQYLRLVKCRMLYSSLSKDCIEMYRLVVAIFHGFSSKGTSEDCLWSC